MQICNFIQLILKPIQLTKIKISNFFCNFNSNAKNVNVWCVAFIGFCVLRTLNFVLKVIFADLSFYAIFKCSTDTRKLRVCYTLCTINSDNIYQCPTKSTIFSLLFSPLISNAKQPLVQQIDTWVEIGCPESTFSVVTIGQSGRRTTMPLGRTKGKQWKRRTKTNSLKLLNWLHSLEVQLGFRAAVYSNIPSCPHIGSRLFRTIYAQLLGDCFRTSVCMPPAKFNLIRHSVQKRTFVWLFHCLRVVHHVRSGAGRFRKCDEWATKGRERKTDMRMEIRVRKSETKYWKKTKNAYGLLNVDSLPFNIQIYCVLDTKGRHKPQ